MVRNKSLNPGICRSALPIRKKPSRIKRLGGLPGTAARLRSRSSCVSCQDACRRCVLVCGMAASDASRQAIVGVLEADDVILTEIDSDLNLDQLERDEAGIGETVHRADRN